MPGVTCQAGRARIVRAGPIAGPSPSAPRSHAAVFENDDAGPPGGSPAGTAGRVARAVWCAMRPAGGALAVAVAVMVAYGLWQVFRWGVAGTRR